MDNEHSSDTHSKGTSTDEREVLAYFPTEALAHRSEDRVAAQATSTSIVQVPEARVFEEMAAAPEGVSTVEIGGPAWVGLALGLIVGAVLGGLVYLGRITIAGIAPALSAGPVAVSFLGAGVLGAIGWLMGAVIHLYRTPRTAPVYEVHAVVPEDARSDVEQKLAEAGAMEVLVSTDGKNGRGQSRKNGAGPTHASRPTSHEHLGSHDS